MIGKIKIEGVEKPHMGQLNVEWDVSTLDSFRATLRVAEDLAGYAEATIERDNIEIFGGRIQTPKIRFGAEGTGMTVEGYDYTIMLQDYLTPAQSIVDKTTAAALALILTNWPHAIAPIDGAFAYISQLEEWETSLEFLRDIELYTDTCIEFAITDPEINNEFRTGTIQSYSAGGLHNCFFYDGTTQRFYIFYREGGDICYDRSVDGVTWTRVVTPYACPSNHFSVAWHDNKVYLFFEGAANVTDLYRGTINDPDGVINFVWRDGDIFANPNAMRFGPVWGNEGHIWVVEEVANGRAWESEDDGASWNARFVGPADHNLWGVVPRRILYGAGDMIGFVLNDVVDDLEEWLYDKSVPSFTRTRKICDTTGDIDALQATVSHHYYNPWVCFRDGTTIYVYSLFGAVWSSRYSGTVGDYDGSFSFCCDAGEAAYLIYNQPAGSFVIKLGGAGDVTWPVTSTYMWYPSGTIFGGSNPFAEEGDLGVFFCALDSDADGWFILFPPTGIRLHEFSNSGSFRADAVTTSGVQWGLLTSENIEVLDDWSILDNANVLLLDGIETTYDLHYDGSLDPAENVVKVKCDLYRLVAQQPYVSAFAISERLDEVTMDTDYEDCFIGVSRLADLAGAEFWVEKAGGVYTLYFSTRRGSDKSNLVVLKSAKTADYPTVEPNIKFLENTFDWDRYANCIKVIGGTVDGVRVEGTVKDPTEIAAFGQEVWKTLRDADILTVSMAVQRGYIELQRRNAVSLRITGRFLDEYDPKDIEIGDSVTLVAEWDDGALKISGSHRIIQLSRDYGADGEQVSASFSNQMKAAEYWAYMSKTATLERWFTA
ncbi:MAG TPA: hypothetical protein VMW50_03195 [Dehalococcoidia bacterium]|nr:hypothetical protein [Dehalococcoidia bacterium]